LEDEKWYITVYLPATNSFFSFQIAEDPAWARCVGSPNNPNAAEYSNRDRPEIVFDAVTDFSNYIALNMSNQGNQRVTVYKAPAPCKCQVVGGAIQCACQAQQFVPKFSIAYAGHDQWGQAMALHKNSALKGSVGLYWRDTRDDVHGNVLVDIWGALFDGPTGNWTWGRLSTLGNGVPFPQSDQLGTNDWGDYEGIVGDAVNNQFVGAWGDNRNGDTEIWGATIAPP
jgi:hypothetical protein